MASGMSRAGFLRRGAVGSGALLISGSGLAAVASAARADTLPDGDLAYLRLLIAAELLAVDFQTKALRGGKLRHAAHTLLRQIRADDTAHYDHLAAQLTDAGGTPATSADIDFRYPRGTFRSQASLLTMGGRLEHLLVGAYVGAVQNVQTPDLRLPLGQIAANEAQHLGALAGLRGEPVVGKAFGPALQMGAVSDALDEFES